MSERTTIGGTVYEAIGSSSSNLLLKCNGTARIQWGNKLIDLIKNGKIVSEGSLELIFIINNESEIKSEGIYVLTTEKSNQLWICKDGNKYNFTDEHLYISTNKILELTVELKKQALDNIGLYYNTLEDVKNAKIQSGIVYVIDTQTLYTIKNGIIEDFSAKLKNITVQSGINKGNLVNDSVKITLSVAEEDYLILSDKRIVSNYSIHVKNSASIGSELSDKNQGYRLYIEGNTAWLDVDSINVRNGINMNLINELHKFIFYRGMIVMHSGSEKIPEGWAICDGGEYEFNGVKSITPNLVNRFIKAVATVEEIKEVNNSDLSESNELTLQEKHLPQHSHPHVAHTHTFSGNGTVSDSFTALTGSSKENVITAIENGTTGEAVTNVNSALITVQDSVYISGTTSSTISLEGTWLYGKTQPIKIEPNYYALIFIMKL